MLTSLSLAELLRLLPSAKLVAGIDTAKTFHKLSSISEAGAQDLSFLSSAKLAAQLQTTQAGAVLLREEHAPLCPAHTIAIVVKDPYLAYAKVSQWWSVAQGGKPPPGIHPLAYVAPTAYVAPDAVISAFAYVGERAVIGAGTWLHPRATVLDDCKVGRHCHLHSGCVIGSDGFGFAKDGAVWVKIEQLGGVVIGDEVEVGANTTIDRGALSDTRIGNGVKLDNQIQIAHNVVIGDNTAIAACVGIAGSTVIGARCTIGGAAGIIGHLKITDDVHISAFSLVQSSITKPGQYTGVFPLDEHASWEKNAASLRQLSKLRDRLRRLEKLENT